MREKEPKSKYYGTPKAGTSKKPRKKPRVEPDNTGPTYAESTPRPSTSRANPETPSDTFAELARRISLYQSPESTHHNLRELHWTPPIWTWE